MRRDIGDRPASDQPVPALDVEMQFATEYRHRDLDRHSSGAVTGLRLQLGMPALQGPARITVLLPALGLDRPAGVSPLLDHRLLNGGQILFFVCNGVSRGAQLIRSPLAATRYFELFDWLRCGLASMRGRE